MEKKMREYLDKNFTKLATKEELNVLSNEVKATREGLNDLRGEVRAGVNNLRGEMKGLEDRVLYQFHITAEGLRDEIKLVTEGGGSYLGMGRQEKKFFKLSSGIFLSQKD